MLGRKPRSAILEFASRELGLTLTPRQAQAIAEFEQGGYQQAVWRWGRRGGKSLLADVLALYDATTRDELRSFMRPGEERVAAIVSTRLDQASAHITNVAGLVAQSPRLRRLQVGQSATEVAFRNGSVVRAFPCSARAVRGGAWSSCVLDELGHFVTTEDGNAAGDRVLEAAQPSLAQFGQQGWLVAISTPLWKQGAFWRLCQRAESGAYPWMHSLHATTGEMNPLIAREWLEQRRREDPETFAREYEARWIDGAFGYLASEDVLACRRGEDKLSPAGFTYVGALDPAYSHDSFAMSVGHRAEDGRVVVDGVWSWRRLGHERTLDEVMSVARAYRLQSVTTDQHAPVPIREGLERRGLAAIYEPWTNESKAAAFAALKIGLNTRTVELPADDRLTEELCGLEARPTPSGQTRIAAAGSGHDDLAVVVAAVVHQLTGRGPNSQTEADYANGVWRCECCGEGFCWQPGRACPRCGAAAPATYRALAGMPDPMPIPTVPPEPVHVAPSPSEPPTVDAEELRAAGFQPWGEDAGGTFRWVRQDGGRPPEYRVGPKP